MATWKKGQGVLSSDWTGLSEHLVASLVAVKRVKVEGGDSYYFTPDEKIPAVVQAPITDGSIEHTINWTSQFEGQGLDQRLGSLTSLLQMGGFDTLIDSFKRLTGDNTVTKALEDWVKGSSGTSALTRLSSTQTFTGMPPSRVSITMHFRALTDPRREVHDPVNQIMQWALPKRIGEMGVINAAVSKDEKVRVFPTEIPQIVGLRYAGMFLLPLVIEGAPYQLTVPRTKDGAMLQQTLTLTLATLSAMDALDWAGFQNGSGRRKE